MISDINLILVLTPKLEPPMDAQMEAKFTEILRAELAIINVHLASAALSPDRHVIKISSPPEVSPLAAARLVMEKVTRRFIHCFDSLEGWGNIYHDRVFIKSGEEISGQQLDDLANFSLSDI